jgi:CarD family transcriptional regulator
MRLTIGKKVFYPYQGLCIIGPVVQKVMEGKAVHFYQLLVLDDGGDLFVPVDKIAAVGIRPLLKDYEIPKLLNQLKLKPSPREPIHYSQRALLYAQLITSGSAFDLVEVVSSLTHLSEMRALSYGQRKTLDKAKRLLIGEISEVMGETKIAVEERIDQALKARKAGKGILQ